MNLRESKPNSQLVENLVRQCSTSLESRPELQIPDGIMPTVLYCTNQKVDQQNYGKTFFIRVFVLLFGFCLLCIVFYFVCNGTID